MAKSRTTMLSVLIIEDSLEDQSLLTDLLSQLTEYHFDVHYVDNGREGLRVLAERRFDCIVLDYRLPDLDGIRVMERLTADGYEDLPVIMMTGQGDERLAVRSLHAGAADYLVKSHLTCESLLRAMLNAIHRNRSAERLRAERALFRREQRDRIEAQEREILALNEARVQRDRLEAFFRQAPTPIAIALGRACVIDLLNEPMRALIKATRPNARKIFTLADAFGADIEHLAREVFTSGTSFKADEFKFAASGAETNDTYFQMTIDPFREAEGIVSGTIMMLADVTEGVLARRQIQASERRARDSEQRLRVATSTSRVGIWEMDFDTRATWRNLEHDQIFGHETLRESWRIEDLFEQVLDEDRGRVAHALMYSLDHRRPFNVEFQVLWPDRSIHWVWMRAGVGETAAGQQRLAGTVVDITERKNRERDLNDARNNAVAASDTKTMFLANMSHEIRTPLNAIIGFTDIIADESTTAADRRRFAETVQRNGRMLMQIIDDILDLSKMEAGKMEVCDEPTSIHALVDDIVVLFQPVTASKGLLLKTRIDPDLPTLISTDHNRLRQIVSNVVSNAVKFTAQGSIELDVRRIDAKGSEARWIGFRVTDTGIGIAEDQQPRLFQAFTQADGTMTRRFGGTGLGLMLSRRLAKLLGGAFFLVKSAPGAGSTFELRLPLVEATATETVGLETPQSTPAAGQLTDVQVLLIDDSEDSRYLARLYLERDQALVTEAHGAAEALKLLATRRFDAIVTDVQMPDMDGYELTRKLRTDGYTLPIIGLTAHAMADDRQHSIESGMNEHLGKPLRAADLIRAVARDL